MWTAEALRDEMISSRDCACRGRGRDRAMDLCSHEMCGSRDPHISWGFNTAVEPYSSPFTPISWKKCVTLDWFLSNQSIVGSPRMALPSAFAVAARFDSNSPS
jgi:hypothetical protein